MQYCVAVKWPFFLVQPLHHATAGCCNSIHPFHTKTLYKNTKRVMEKHDSLRNVNLIPKFVYS